MASTLLSPQTSSTDPLTNFLQLSQTLFSLISTENAFYAGDHLPDFSALETQIGHKTILMQNFEKEAQNLLNFISIGLSSSKTRQTVTGEVEKIREALKKNSVLQLRRLKAKIAGPAANIEMPEKGLQVTCH